MADPIQQQYLEKYIDRRPVRVVAVCSGKGGAGKTNVAANLAVALTARRRRVCLMDADVSLANVDVLLGLQPRYNLAHVVSGEARLEETLLRGPSGVRIVPAASGNFDLTELSAAGQASLVRAFSDLAEQPDALIVDTAAGISPTVARFVQAAQHAVVVVCDEPASLTDAYALIKVFSRHYGISRFHVVTNRCRSARAGRELFSKLSRVTDNFLDVVLRHLGDIPEDRYLRKAVQEQRAVVEAYPGTKSAAAFTDLAARVDALPDILEASGGIEFFLERLLEADAAMRGKVA